MKFFKKLWMLLVFPYFILIFFLIRNLKIDLNNLREKGVPDGEDEIYGRVCKRCRTPLGLLFNSGALCPNCSGKVCKSCRVTIDPPIAENSWLCTVCAKIRYKYFSINFITLLFTFSYL